MSEEKEKLATSLDEGKRLYSDINIHILVRKMSGKKLCSLVLVAGLVITAFSIAPLGAGANAKSTTAIRGAVYSPGKDVNAVPPHNMIARSMQTPHFTLQMQIRQG